jgi:hypothetical protein
MEERTGKRQKERNESKGGPREEKWKEGRKAEGLKEIKKVRTRRLLLFWESTAHG